MEGIIINGTLITERTALRKKDADFYKGGGGVGVCPAEQSTGVKRGREGCVNPPMRDKESMVIFFSGYSYMVVHERGGGAYDNRVKLAIGKNLTQCQ